VFGWVILAGLAIWGIAHLVRTERDYQKWASQRDRENEQNEPSDGSVG
jgi:hypothetical protein